MHIKPHYETYRYNALLCKAESQSIVECRFAGGEISTVLSVEAHLSGGECSCDNGEVRYTGKLVVTIVYEDGEKKVCRGERGAEFSHRAQNEKITPSAYATVGLCADDVTVKREGSGVYVSVVVGARFFVYATRCVDYLYDGEGLVVKREPTTFFKVVTASATVQAEDDFETDYAIDLLMHSERVYLTEVRAEEGQVALSGEVALNACALKEDGSLCSYERLVPFRAEVPCPESVAGATVEGRVSVKSATLSLTADEEKGKCKVEAELLLFADCTLHFREELSACLDGYSTACELAFQTETNEARIPVETYCFTERIGGTAALSESIDYSVALKAVLRPRVEISCAGKVVQGAVFADVVLCDKDGEHKCARMSLPFLLPAPYGDGVDAEADAIVCGLGVRQRKEGSAEAEGTLKVRVTTYKKVCSKYLSSVEEGKEYEPNGAAISVYLPHAGDGLWETAKRLKRTPEEVEKSNPELTFPLRGNERIFVYRQKN